MLCRANIGSENDMFNIHGQDQGLPWDPGGSIELHSARLHTDGIRTPPSYPFPSQIPVIRCDFKASCSSYSFNQRCQLDSLAVPLPTPQHTQTQSNFIHIHSQKKCYFHILHGISEPSLSPSKFHGNVVIRIKGNILPVLMCTLFLFIPSEHLVSPSSLPASCDMHYTDQCNGISGSLTAHLPLFLRSVHAPGRIPSTGLPSCPSATDVPHELVSQSAVYSN